jgi:hypothetical protein
MDLFNLRAKLTLDVEDYEKKIDNAKEKGKDFSDKTEKQIGIISADAWTSLAGKVIDVAKKIAQASLETLNYADNIGDMAGKWGFTTKEIQEFDYWATMNGTTLESLLTGMRGLVNQAEAGANAFKVLGVNVKNNDGTLKGQKQLFLETLDALQKIPNQTQRNALQFEIFGRAGIELGQVIGRSTEELEELTQQAEEFGIILDEKTINSAGDFNDVLDRLKLQGKTAFAGLITGAEDGQQKFDEFLKNITYAIEMLTPKFYEIGGKLGMSLIEGFGKYLIDRLWGILKWTVGEGWLWGDKPTDNFFGNYFQSMGTVSGGLFDNTPTTSIFESQSNMSSANDNSTTNVTVNMTSTGYTSEDARNLANEVIKEIATKKQASGR